MSDNRSCADCIYRHIWEQNEWLYMSCKKWQSPYSKDPFYDVPCEYYESKEEEKKDG